MPCTSTLNVNESVHPELVFSTIIGVFVFSERLDIFILLGVFIVVSSGLYTFWREKVVKNLKS